LYWYDAKRDCNVSKSVLLSITNNDTQSAFQQFRQYVSTSYDAIANSGVWLDVTTDQVDSFHWVTGSRGSPIIDGPQDDYTKRFGVVGVGTNNNNLVYMAQKYDSNFPYICQTYSDDCQDGFSRSSRCYRKYNKTVTWFAASNSCLSKNGSLATFNDLNSLSGNTDVAAWLNMATSTTKYWLGLVRQWFVTTGPDGSVVDVQYTNWDASSPSQPDSFRKCVVVVAHSVLWSVIDSCQSLQNFVCQVNVTRLPATTLATTTLNVRSTTPSSPVDGSTVSSVRGSASATPSVSDVSSAPTLSTGVIVGVVVGVVGGVVIVIVVVVVLVLLRRRSGKHGGQISEKPRNIYEDTGYDGISVDSHRMSPMNGADWKLITMLSFTPTFYRPTTHTRPHAHRM
jgi:hypothetical protein